MLLQKLLPLLVFIVGVTPVIAQDDDLPLSATINYGDQVADDLTARAFWDWWLIFANEGETLIVNMQGDESLEPLVGILGPGGNLVARSDDGLPGGAVTLEYTAEEAGEHTIVATRVGNENGTSTGPYTLQVQQANPPLARVNPYQEVVFRCQDYDVTNALTVIFEDDPDQPAQYVISVYGLDGFAPVIRAYFENFDLTDCSRDAQAVANNVFTLPTGESVTLIDNFDEVTAQLGIMNASEIGPITLTIGSADGKPGRFIAVIDGLVIGEDDIDEFQVGQGPMAATRPLTIYMVADQATRLDPALALPDHPDEIGVCDDAGRRGCENIPSPEGLEIYLAEIDRSIVADRFDAGAILAAGPPELRNLELSSFDNRTTGRYTLVFIGELPARD